MPACEHGEYKDPFEYMDLHKITADIGLDIPIGESMFFLNLVGMFEDLNKSVQNYDLARIKEVIDAAMYVLLMSTDVSERIDEAIYNNDTVELFVKDMDEKLEEILNESKGHSLPDKIWGNDPHFYNTDPDKTDALNPDFKLAVRDKSEEAVQVLLRKHLDYGPKNISQSPGGALNGLRVRLFDKIARLNHLIDTGADPENESLYDTFLDICNYGMIGMLVLDDMWDKEK